MITFDKLAFKTLLLYISLMFVGTHIFNGIMQLIFVALFACTLFANYRHIKVPNEIIPFFILMIYGWISTIWSMDKSYAFAFNMTMLKCLLFSIIIVLLATSTTRIDKLLICFVVGGYILNLYCIATIGVDGLINLSSQEMRLGDEDVAINANTIGYINALAAVIIMYIGQKYKKKMMYLLMIPVAVILLVSASRAALIMLLVGVFLMLILINRNYKAATIIASLIGIIILFFVLSNYGLLGTVSNRLTSMLTTLAGNSSERSTTVRVQLIQIGLKEFIDNPFFGYGSNQFNPMSKNYFSMAWSPHNAYIQSMVSFGLIGLVLWQGSLFYFVYRLRKFRNDNQAVILLILVICWLIGDLFNHSLTDKISYYVIGLTVSYFCINRKSKEGA